jgi:RimJ/RimL family protein N-acetyltransferase
VEAENPPDTVQTARLLLRRATLDDLEALHVIMSDEETMRYWSTLPHQDLETTRQWLLSMIAPPSEASDDFIITCDGETVGKVGAWRLPEVGFLLSRRCWGKGYAVEALRAYVARAFQQGASHLVADVDPRNAASLRVLSRCGFLETSRSANTWCVGGVWTDSVYLRLDRPDA